MIYRFISISIFLCALVSPNNGYAVNIKTADGNNIGNFEKKEIQRSEARISIDLENRYITKIVGGFVANARYREYWGFKGGSILLDSIGGASMYYLETDKSRVLKLFKTKKNSGRFEVTKIKKLRSNIYYILAKDSINDVNCAFVTAYWGSTQDSEGLGSIHGRISICDPESKRNPEDSLKEALYLFGNMKYDGNKLQLGYKFPTKKDVEKLGGIFSPSYFNSKTPTQTKLPNSTRESDSYICMFAASNGEWATETGYQRYVREAQRRGLTCGVAAENGDSSANSLNNELEEHEKKCAKLGFTKGTEKYGDCVMKLYK
jgi:hypothetical protein